MKTFNIYKKRDGQSFKLSGYIYESDFESAKKEFAKNVANDLHNDKGDIVYLTEEEGAPQTGFYDLNCTTAIFDEETEKYDSESLEDGLIVTQESIDTGFDYWNEDVYTYELREMDYIKIYDLSDFEENKDKFEFFMSYQSDTFFLYNNIYKGHFEDIAEYEGLGFYHPENDDFMGCPTSETETIYNYLSE